MTDNLSPLALNLISIAEQAGQAILSIYQQDDFQLQIKSDNSPHTAADLASHSLIVEQLQQLTPEIPILSEESANIPWEERKTRNKYWLIDPLDGTKEFIKRNGEFTVNIALIENHQPILGVVHAPELNQTWCGEQGKPAIKITNGKTETIQVKPRQQGEAWKVVGSRSHAGDSLKQYLQELGEHELISMGSSIKLCLVAEGKAHIYPRLGPTSEWDTAAAHAVVNAAGGGVINHEIDESLQYNTKDSLLNPHFIVKSTNKVVLVTGGAGFIGSAVIRHYVANTNHTVINVDKLTYAGNLESLGEALNHPRHIFKQLDICDRDALDQIFDEYKPNAVMHLAAESHVDRSINGPAEFMNTNIIGTYTLLEVARSYWSKLEDENKAQFRFHHVSTDEVYGDLEEGDGLFSEETPYAPSSPYSASKASSDHLVRAWNRTYKFPILITNCSNNYGPYQFPEKLIPLVILNAISGKPLPVYGKGNQIRDWLYVEDHARALAKVLEEGKDGETYNIGGLNEKTNLEVVKTLCSILDELVPVHPNGINKYEDLITYVADRPGHDVRYAIDNTKIIQQLSWNPDETFETGIRKTVKWYLNNESWWKRVQEG